MVDIIKKIIKESSVPPVIVIQGDHGYEYNQDRVKILNAYYLPNGGKARLYSTLTPVNTFRVIFDQYFGENYPLLPDISYYSPNTQPYTFDIVTNSCSSGQ